MVPNMLQRALRVLWGELSMEEIKRYGLLALTFFFIVGSYWLLKALKDAIFNDLVSFRYQPEAKIASVIVIIPLILLYTELVDRVGRHYLFYIVCSFYAATFAVIAYLIANPVAEMHSPLIDWIPGKALGWITYLAAESYGTITIAMFWSFMATMTNTAAAKRSYAMIVISGQTGAIVGPTLVTYAPTLGVPLLLYYGAIGIALVPLFIYVYITYFQTAAELQALDQPSTTGLFEGLHLLWTRSYLMGIFVVATVYEVVGTIMDYQMKILASAEYPTRELLAAFMGRFGQASNILALTFAIFGTSYFIRRFSIQMCLVLFPVSIALVLGYVLFNPSLYSIFVAMIMIKGLSYALNNPAKEMLYIPTSKDVKFKTKSWIDMFGSRYSKAMGSVVNKAIKTDAILYGTLVSLGVVGFWVVIAVMVGKRYNRLVTENEIVQ